MGQLGDVPIAADFDGDGRTEHHGLSALDRRMVHPLLAGRCDGQPLRAVSVGARWVTRPLVEDFDGDGKTELTVYRPATGEWLIRYSSLGYSAVSYDVYQWGAVGIDIPLP